MRRDHRMLLLVSCVLLTSFVVADNEIGFNETFALATNRAATLEQLIPGTEDFYYYQCLLAQQRGDTSLFQTTLDQWVKRHGTTATVKIMRNRQALLQYSVDPQATLAYLRNELNPSLGYAREVFDGADTSPTQLDQKLISFATLRANALAGYNDLSRVTDAGLEYLDAPTLTPVQLRDFLRRLAQPDYPGLPTLIIKDLAVRDSGTFGSLPIHTRLTLQQLDECLQLKPALRGERAFVNAYLARLAPSDDIDLRNDPAAQRAYAQRLWSFVETLSPAFNSLKATVLYQLLDLARAAGEYDRPLFMAYLQLPRDGNYLNRDNAALQRDRADLGADFRALIMLPPVGNDEALVRDYLMEFLRTADSRKAFAPFIDDDYLRDLFAETKIVNGIGDMAQWFSLMNPARYEALKQRVDLQFAPQNQRFFAADAPVTLDLFVKNADTLVVKTYEINAFNYYKTTTQEIDAGIDLDGLVASHEETLTYSEPALRRVRRTFALPQLSKPGVYVVEFIGNGKSSRAVVRKGGLRCIQRPGPAGHAFLIWDDTNQRRTNATIWLAGQEYHANADGVVIVPFSTSPGRVSAILRDGALCTLTSFEHQAETYQLSAGFYIDRESLLRDAQAALVVRPVLTVAGQPISVSVLENVQLVVESTDHDGIVSSSAVADFPLSDTAEAVHHFRVPPRLSSVRITLKARVTSLSNGKPEDLAASTQFTLNTIDHTTATDQLLLSRDTQGYLLSLRGKNGEARPHRPLSVMLRHRLFVGTPSTVLQTDDHGDVRLGALVDITGVDAVNHNTGAHATWQLDQPWYRYPALVQGCAGVPVRIPWGAAPAAPRPAYCLFSLRNGAYLADLTDQIVVRDGFLVTPALAAGDYELFVKDQAARVCIRVTAGRECDGVVLSPNRLLEADDNPPLQITALEPGRDAVRITLSRTDAWVRVHVFAARFLPDFEPFAQLACLQPPALIGLRPLRPEARYLAERAVGDEYQYILNRRRAPHLPGTLLTRPGLLLNPWSISKTETTIESAVAGEAFEPLRDERAATPAPAAAMRHAMVTLGIYDNLDFLAAPARVWLNLRPDAQGVISLPRTQLTGYRQVYVVAVDPLHTVCRQITLPPVAPATRDLRLANGLDPTGTFAQQKLISVLVSGQTVRIPDVAGAEYEIYDTLGRAYQLLATLSGDATLREFSFITTWPALSNEAQRVLYAKYACHELNFFLYHQDRTFFDAVVKPYLRNKKDKTFMDRWLLEEDLTAFIRPWAYNQLNIAERILLAQRGADTPAHMRRAVQDLCDLLPPNPDEFNRLFDTALRGRALERSAGMAGRWQMLYDNKKQGERDDYELSTAAGDEPAMVMSSAMPASAPSAMPDMRAREERKSTRVDSLARGALAKDGALALRQRVRALYRAPDKTEEWAENNYYHRRMQEQNAALVTATVFWNDYAHYDGSAPFLSRNLAYAARNFTEAMLALAVLDLPFSAGAHTSMVQDAALDLTAASPLIVYHKEITASAITNAAPLLLSQRLFNPLERFTFDGNEQIEKFITAEFLAFTPYGAKITLSNPSGQRRNLNLLLQLPVGALPLQNGFYTRGLPLRLEPNATYAFEYYFYFPTTGVYRHAPAQVAESEHCVARAAPATLTVLFKPSAVDTGSWQFVSQNGSLENVLAFMQTHNLHRLDLNKIAFRMKESAAFDAAIRLLDERHIYSATLWAYSLLHNRTAALAQYLLHSPLAEQCGPYFVSPLLTLDPVERRAYEHLEYAPLINARVQQLGARRRILNDRFFAQYQRLMDILCCVPHLTSEDCLAVTYYFLLQGRIEEARAFFATIDPATLVERLQYDYSDLYLAFCAGDTQRARAITARYQAYPVPRWRALFADARAQLDELDGAAAALSDPQNREQRQTVLAAGEPALEVTLEGHTVTLDYRNLDACRVNYYPMDIELLFSRNPFVRQQGGQFAYVTPPFSVAMPLATNQQRISFDVPERFRTSNVMLEVAAGPLARTQVYYANALEVQMLENYGRLQVTRRATRAPLPAVYIKVYARMADGSITFYKDGYTDLRGTFDYVSLSTDELDRVARFALLIMSDDCGALIREAAPPKR